MNERPDHISAKWWSIGFVLLLLAMGLRALWLGWQDGNNLFTKFRLDRLTITTRAFDAELSQYGGGDTTLFYPLGAVYRNVFQRSLSRKILPGQDDWLFLWADQADIDPLEQRLGLTRLRPLDHYELLLQYQQRAYWCEQEGMQYLMVFAPNKASIYGEYLPPMLMVPETTFADDLLAGLQEINVPLLDLRPPLLAAKSQAPLYYHHDTHWNQLGAWYGTEAVVKRLGGGRDGAKGPFTEPTPLSPPRRGVEAFARRPKTIKGGDQLRMARLRGTDYTDEEMEVQLPDSLRFEQMDPPMGVPYDQPYYSRRAGADLPRTLLLHDSFGHGMRPWLSYHCRELLALWGWGEFRAAVAQEFQPVWVLDEIIERNLARPYPGNEAALVETYWRAHFGELRPFYEQNVPLSLAQLKSILLAGRSQSALMVAKISIFAPAAGEWKIQNGQRITQSYTLQPGQNELFVQLNPHRPIDLQWTGEGSLAIQSVVVKTTP